MALGSFLPASEDQISLEIMKESIGSKLEQVGTLPDEWIDEYKNRRRPHKSLGKLTPYECKMKQLKLDLLTSDLKEIRDLTNLLLIHYYDSFLILSPNPLPKKVRKMYLKSYHFLIGITIYQIVLKIILKYSTRP